ncbi:MAG: hypothetical protein NE328_19495 [Lentisphaeraceae bacterium]|nr:hypothetical protein [Lentisphaeraceae bacterium]
MGNKYDEVEKLIEAVRNLQLSISKSPYELNNDGHFYQRVRLIKESLIIDFPIMDEFSDIEKGNPVVLLNFILQECLFFEDAGNFEEWCEDIGLQKDKPASMAIYEELKIIIPEIRSLLGHEIKPINYYDIEFNTGIAKALRAATI